MCIFVWRRREGGDCSFRSKENVLEKNVKKSLVVIILAILTLCPAHGQETLRGVVSDTSGAVVASAVVELFDGADTTARFVDYAVTDSTGQFLISGYGPKRHTLRVSCFDYEPFVGTFEHGKDTVVLVPEINRLEAAVATADYTKFRANRITVDMVGNPLAEGKQAATLLRYLPGVHSVGKDYAVFGKTATVYINNRMLRNQGELENLSAEKIEKIEIIPMAGSKYNSTNEGSIVKITLKRPETGTFGTLSASSGVYYNGLRSVTGDASINHRSGNLSLYGDVYASSYHTRTVYGKDARYPDSGISMTTNSVTKADSYQLQGMASAMYDFSENHSLGILFRAYYYPEKSFQKDNNHTIVPSGNRTESGYESDTDSHDREFQTSLNYSLGLDDNGSILTVMADWLKSIDEFEMPYSSTGNPGLDALKSGVHDSWTAQDMFRADADMTKIFSDGSELDLGLSGNLVSADDKYDGNGYRYKGRNLSSYAQVSKEFGDVSLQAGLRYEHDNIWYKPEGTSSASRSYDRLFPSVMIGWSIDDDKDRNLSFGYERRGGGMPYWYISPEKKWTGEFSYQVGNLSLGPDKYHDFEVIYSHNSKLSATLILDFRKDLMTRVTKTDADDPLVRYVTFENAGKNFYYALDLEYKPWITKWWYSDFDVLLAMSRYVYPAESYNDFYSFWWWDNDFRFGTWGGRLSFSGETPRRLSPETKFAAVYHSSASVYRYLFKNRFLVQLSASNPIGIGRTEYVDTPDYHLKNTYKSKIWTVTLSLTYNFSSGKRKDFKQVSSLQSTRRGTYSAQ